ncbi:MAG: hypothetical protein D4R67_10345 [Bacteroidetes bacterium]|nr:MAG: hypothetical protein D4R67_10345 [Bacteroidota bacterium]
MKEETCSHTWEMVNVQSGYIVTENCFRCNKTATSFSAGEWPPMEEYREGEHFWNIMEVAQTIRFDLTCKACGKLVPLNELAGLMMCTGCDPKCPVDTLMKEMEKSRIWVFVAFGFFPVDERTQLSQEKIAILEEYFNQRRKSSSSTIRIVSSEKIDDISRCFAEMIRDVGMLSLTPPATE